MAAFPDRLALVEGAFFPIQAHLAHDIPGRLRVILPDLKGDRRRAASLRAQLRRQAAEQNVHINPLTGSVLIEYDGSGAARTAIIDALESAGYRLARPTPPRPDAAGPYDRVASAVAGTVLNWMVKRALHGALAALI